MVQRLYKLSPMFIRCFGVIEGRSLDLRSSHALIFCNISAGTRSVLRRCPPWYDSAFRMMVRNIFLAVVWKPSFAQLVLYLHTILVTVGLL